MIIVNYIVVCEEPIVIDNHSLYGATNMHILTVITLIKYNFEPLS